MQTAMEAGVDALVELGGGIGKGDGPAEKRPNLEGMIKKALKSQDHDARHLSAINLDSIQATAAEFAG